MCVYIYTHMCILGAAEAIASYLKKKKVTVLCS